MDNINRQENMLLQQKKALEHSIAQLIAKEHLSGPEFEDGFLKGQICLKRIRCGKKNCKCTMGEKETFGHGPYPHLQWWDNGKVKTRYLNRKKYPIYQKILHWQSNLKTVEKNLKKIEKTKNNKDK